MKLLILVLGLVAYALAQCQKIVSRSEWGARPASTPILPVRPARWYVIHHTTGASCNNKAACSAEMRAIQNMDMDTNLWSDIRYHFLIGGDGLVYEGRGWGKNGAHAPGYNDKSVGICFIGNFTKKMPKKKAMNVAKQLISCGVSFGHVNRTYGLIGHKQAIATECPGNRLYQEIQSWPNWKP